MRNGFIAAALYNILGILLVTKGFSSAAFFNVDPALFSAPACLVIMIWGLAYLALSPHWQQARWVSLAFAIEKLFYAAYWVIWLTGHSGDLEEIWARDVLSGLFFSVYGAGDALFMLFFFYAWHKARPTT